MFKLILCSSITFLVGCNRINNNTSKKAVLVVSFGTSFIKSRENSIDAIESKIVEAYPEYSKFTAFTSNIIIDVYKDRDNIEILDVNGAISKIYKEKYGEVLVIPTHVINGLEYDQMIAALDPFRDKFAKLTISKPLLTDIEDYNIVVDALIEELPVIDKDTAVVLMGHGTHHDANSAYPALDYVFKHKGYNYVFVGTVEGFPSFDSISKQLKNSNYKKVLLMPLMIVAGDHAYNDMAGDGADSWKNLLKSMGYEVEIILKGLGELSTIQNLFIEHAKSTLKDEVM